MKSLFYNLSFYWKKFTFFVQCRLLKNPFKDKQCLKVARKSDQTGNYDIDGVSFDGDHIHVGGKV
jgi:hypothetical protein